MTMRGRLILIQGGRVMDPSQGQDVVADLLIEDGKVSRIGKNLKAEGAEILSAQGKWVTPGFIDLHVHFRSPGQEHKETIETGSKAALRGGFTTVCTMANTDPVVDSFSVVEYVKSQSAKVGLVNVLPYAAVTIGLKGEALTEMGRLKEAGVAGFSDDGAPIANAGVMRRALEYTRLTKLPVIAHCEEPELISHGVMHEGKTALRLGLSGIPSEAESVMIARDILLAQATGGRLHIAHVSTKEGVSLIRQAKANGVCVTAEVTPHHLTLTDEALNTYEARFKMNPPLRGNEDLQALREGLKDGTLDAVATDHAPHASHEKEVEISSAPFGVVGLETAFGVLLTELVSRKVMDAATLIAAFTSRPAKVLGLDRGTLRAGSVADVAVIDPEQHWTVEANSFSSKGTFSPFLGWRLQGRVTDVLVAGAIRLQGGQFLNGERRVR